MSKEEMIEEMIDDNELKYINYDSYHDCFIVRKNRKYYCSFKSLDEAIKARNWLFNNNWDKKGLKKIIANKYKYYTKENNYYVVTKHVDKVRVVFARCKTEAEAKKTVKLLKQLNWDKEKFKEVMKKNKSRSIRK